MDEHQKDNELESVLRPQWERIEGVSRPPWERLEGTPRATENQKTQAMADTGDGAKDTRSGPADGKVCSSDELRHEYQAYFQNECSTPDPMTAGAVPVNGPCDVKYDELLQGCAIQSFMQPSNCVYPLLVEVTGSTVGIGRLNAKHTTYIIHIDDCGKVHNCKRRYKEFLRLHSDLWNRGLLNSSSGVAVNMAGSPSESSTVDCGGSARSSSTCDISIDTVLPSLPPKSLFQKLIGNTRSDFVDVRRQLLEDYLQMLLQVEAVVRDRALWSFLDADFATAIVMRFTRFPITHENVSDKLEQLERVADEELLNFRLCCRPVAWSIVCFARQLLREPLQADSARYLLRIFNVMRPLLAHSYGRAGLVEAGAVSALVAAMRRALEDPAKAMGVGCEPSQDARQALLAKAIACVRQLLEDTRNAGPNASAFMHFIELEDGVAQLQGLSSPDSPPPLRRAVADMLWAGLEEIYTAPVLLALPLPPDSPDGLSTSRQRPPDVWLVLSTLLQAPDLYINSIAAFCLGQLVRHEAATALCEIKQNEGPVHEEFTACLHAIPSITAKINNAVIETEGTLGGSTNLLAWAVVDFLCSAQGISRLVQLLSGTKVDSITDLVATVIDHFVVHHHADSSALAALSGLLPHLRRVLDITFTITLEDDLVDKVQTRIARILLHIDPTYDSCGESLGAADNERRVKCLHKLLDDDYLRLSLTTMKVDTALSFCQERVAAIETEGLLKPLIDFIAPETAELCRRISDVDAERSSLGLCRMQADELICAASIRLDACHVECEDVQKRTAELLKNTDVLRPQEEACRKECEEIKVCEAQAEVLASELEILRPEYLDADAQLQTVLRRVAETSAHVLDLREAAENYAHASADAPTHFECVQKQIAECDACCHELSSEMRELSMSEESSQKHITALQEGLEDGNRALAETRDISQELQELRSQHECNALRDGKVNASDPLTGVEEARQSSESSEVGAEDERADQLPDELREALGQLESQLRSHRPLRINWPSEWERRGGSLGPSEAPNWLPFLDDFSRQLSGDSLSYCLDASMFSVLEQLVVDLDHLWLQELQWIDDEKERMRKNIRTITRDIKKKSREAVESNAKTEELQNEAASCEAAAALLWRRDEEHSEMAAAVEILAQAEATRSELEERSRLCAQEFSEARLKVQDAEGVVSNAKGMEWAARARGSKARVGLEAFTLELEEHTGKHLKVLASEFLPLRQLRFANTCTDQALANEAQARLHLRHQVQELVKRLHELDDRLNVDPEAFPDTPRTPRHKLG